MKFDVVIGNPPYQENDNGKRVDGSANASAKPLYHFYMNLAKKVGTIQSLIMPARWTTGAGKGLGTFSKETLSDNHFKSFHLYTNSSDIFSNIDIKGGIVYFVRDANYAGPAEILVTKNSEQNKRIGYLDKNNLGVFIPYSELNNIFEKIRLSTDLENRSLQKITSVRKPYGLCTDFFLNQTKYNLPPVSLKKKSDDDIKIIGLLKGKRVIRYVPKDYPVPAGNDSIYTYKVFVPYAYGSGMFGETIPEQVIGEKGMISTETFLRIGNFSTINEALALKKYLCTKFARSLIGILKITQHSTTTYKLVPLQNFKMNSEINWSESIPEIDQQLYKKYGLDQNEIDFIESKVKPMD